MAWTWALVGASTVAALFVVQAALARWDWRSAWTWLLSYGLEALAIALSPLIALQVSAEIDRARDADNRKMEILQTLMATRHAMLSDDRVRALNRITVLFSDDPDVLDAHKALMNSLSKPINADGTVPQDLQQEWNDAQWRLASAIAATLNVKITKDEFALGYAPRIIATNMEAQQLLIETNKSLLNFARKELGLRWDPKFLAQLPPGVGIIGPYQEPPTTETPTPAPPS